MKDKKYKYTDDMIEDYLRLTDEQLELPYMMDKAHKKLDALMANQKDEILKKSELEEAHKIFMQISKGEDRQKEIAEELKEAETHLKQFLSFLKGKQIAYEKRDDTEKIKLTYLFWLEGDQIKSNRK